jgi:PAS domain S-box-containing protein
MKTRDWLAPSAVTAGACLAGGALTHAAVQADVYATGLPAGIGLAALLIWGLRVLPGILFASVLGIAFVSGPSAQFLHGELPDWPLLLGPLHTARLLLGWWLLARLLQIDVKLSRVRDVFALVLVTAVALPLLGVLVQVAAGILQHGLPIADWSVIAKRAFDEAVGLLLVVPAVLSWTRPRPVEATARCRVETAGLLFVTALASVIVYGALRDPSMHMESLRYALFPLVFWAALRLAMRETAALLLLSGSIALALSGLASAGMAPMGLPDPHLFLLALSITGLVGAAAQQQRVLADLLLRESEHRYRMLIENMNEGVIMTDRDARVTFVSDRFCEMIGYSRDEMLGRTGEEVTVPEDREAWRDAQQRRRQGIQQPYALTMRRKDGELVNMWISPRPLFDADGNYEGSLNIVLDMTAQRRAEDQSRQHLQQLAHVSRLSSMGEMASAIAHEINQPLTAIANYANASLRLLRAGKITPQETTATMERLAAEAARAGEVVRKMRGFVKGEEGHLAAVEVGFLISEVLRLAQPEARQYGVELGIAPLPELPPVFADSIQIQQVLLNLVRNAVEAIASGECERRTVTVSAGLADEGKVQIAVTDTGPGISPDELERVFDAFFTTKPDGIGIGLALSRSIAEAHGGTLDAGSTPQGAVFRLTLPAARETEIADA